MQKVNFCNNDTFESVWGESKGVLHNTLVDIANEYMGSQWALFMPTLVVV